MNQNKKGISPTYVLEVKNLNIQEIVCSVIEMFSVFRWDSKYKNPHNDAELNKMLENLQKYIEKNYKEG